MKVDEWHHDHCPDGDKHPHLFAIWYWLFRPLCNYVDWRFRRPARASKRT